MNKKILQTTLATTLLLSFLTAGCQKAEPVQQNKQTNAVVETQKTSSTQSITDSAGRQITIPASISKIAPSGPLAQIILYTAVPDKLAGLSNPLKDNQKEYLSDDLDTLPVFGQFYGKHSNLNMEELVKNQPDVVIDIGEPKDSIVTDMDELQKQINIPTIFVASSLETMPDTYKTLGNILGEKSKTEKLAKYTEDVIKFAKDNKPAEDQQTTVYWAMGDSGLNTNAKDSFQSEVLNLVGAKNVVDLEPQSKGGATEISMEQLIQWNPKVLLADNQNLYDLITTDPTWSNLDAVKNKMVYRIPSEPYGFLSNPPSVNRVIGVKWLGNLLYPEKYTSDIKSDLKEFYELFYNSKIDDSKVDKILTNSISIK